MNFILDSLTGAGSTFGILAAIDFNSLPLTGSLEELINYLVSVLGGILAAVIIRILRKKFPELFETLKSRNKSHRK